LPQKFCTLADSLGIAEPFVMIADAYYACTVISRGLGKLPPTEGTSLWWPTEFELSECSDSFALEADCLAKEK
jgi:hypothetical protein